MGETDTVSRGTTYWPYVIVRAIPALVVGVVITFSPNHSAALGLAAFGAFTALSGAVLVLSRIRLAVPARIRTTVLAQGVVSIVAGAAAFVFMSAGLPLFLYLVSVWAAVTGFLELYTGLSNRGRDASARDWTFVGALTAAFAIVMLLIPADLQDPWAADNGATGVLTASVFGVGALGAYAAVLGVYLAIAGLSLKWSAQPTRTPEPESAP